MSESMGTVTAPTNEDVVFGDYVIRGFWNTYCEAGDPDGALVPLPVRKPTERVVPPLPVFTYAVMLK